MSGPAAESIAALPGLVKYLIWSISGIGPLWFIQDLWLLSLVLLVVRKMDAKGKFMNLCGKVGMVPLILMGVLFWLGHQTLIMEPDPAGANGLWNLYKPVFYLIPFLMGYFVFSHDSIQEIVGRAWIPLMVCALVSGTILTLTGFGQDNTLPKYLSSPLNNIYGWLMCLAMMGWFKTSFDRTGAFASYMTRSSYGIYIVHYLVIATIGYFLKTNTQMSSLCIYILLTIAVYILSPLLYELLKRIPFIRWCVLGEKK